MTAPGAQQRSPEHLTDRTLALLSEDRLPPGEKTRVRAHAAECPECEELVAGALQVLETWTPPDTFDVFRLEEEIGRGAMGVVYRAFNLRLMREVALKFIASQQADTRIQDYFQNEAHALAQISHPNVLTVHSYSHVDGHPYIETEYIKGQSLARLALPLAWPRALDIAVELARGLAEAHRKGVLHRDIKPSNAILSESGVVKLLDFGLAERLDPGSASTAGARAGTLGYMSPECVRRAPATERSDLYSLGVVLFQLCTGRIPDPDERLGPGVDPVFAAAIERCLRADPAARFASAELLREALEPIRSRLPRQLAPNPYRGLASFEKEHQALFFGRDGDLREVLERLRRHRMVIVAAESGAGKSSLCRAGVLPRAATDVLAEGRALSTLILSPGRRPLEALAAALAPAVARDERELFTILADDPGQVRQRLHEVYRHQGGLLLFVDQLEELLTASDPSQREGFTRALGEIARASPAVRLLLAVRGDFFTRVAALPGLEDRAEHAFYLLRPMTPEGLRAAIVRPAHAFGVSFESEDLIQDLVKTTAHGAGSLPLLSFALTEVWELRDIPGARITRAALDSLGGVAGVLSRHADGVVARLSAEETQEARRLLIRLTTEDRTRVELGEDELDAGAANAQAALQVLVAGRLLQTRAEGGRVCYQIAHDSLIQSWPLLRNWLDDDVGHRALRQRVEAATREWARQGRSQDALWPKRQLDEARPLEPSTLGAVEQQFLNASWRRVRWRTWQRRLAVTLAVLAVASPFAGFRLQQWREERAFVNERLEAARLQLEAAEADIQTTLELRVKALALFDGPSSQWKSAEAQWREVLDKRGEAQEGLRGVERSLQGILDRAHRREDTRRLLSDVTYRALELEESFHPQGSGADSVRELLTRFDDAAWQQRVAVPARLELVTQPAGARVELERAADGGKWEPVRLASSVTPISDLVLPPGSYRFRFTANGRAPVTLPELMTRGLRRRIDVVLPASVPDGFVYVPPGCFLFGSDDETMRRYFLRTSPLHQLCMEHGYLIGRTEITFEDWLKYLESLPSDATARQVLERLRYGMAEGGVTLRQRPDVGWVLSFNRAGNWIFRAPAGTPFRYLHRTRNDTGDWRQLPLSGVAASDLEGYFSWLDRSGRLPGARLCSELEWERAGRGADARPFPNGDVLSPNDANIDETYGRHPGAYGPDVVGSHPTSASPFGLEDMAGNAMELTLAQGSEPVGITLRGGSWYHTDRTALSANRAPGELTMRDGSLGARACASYLARVE